MPACATTAFGVLCLVSWWWALPAAAAAFLLGRQPGRGGPFALFLVGALGAGAAAVSVAPSLLALGTRFVAVVVLVVLPPWFLGRFRRQYRELARAGWERAGQLERERQLVAEQARSQERSRIAQDMHDALGHDLSLIALSAGALKLAPGLDEQHRRTAQDIRGRAAAAVERLGEVIGVLREETEPPPVRPADSDIARLVGDAAASGLAVELSVDGEAVGLPASVERAAYRVVQEALTNAVKHAPGAPVRVALSHTATETRVVVGNADARARPGPPPKPGPGGRGLIGLDERVRLAGGSLDHGPRDGGFVVAARLPHDAPAQPLPRSSEPRAHEPEPWPSESLPPEPPPSVQRSAGPPPSEPRPSEHQPPPPEGRSTPPPEPGSGALSEYRRARLRVGRTLLTALVAPLAAGAVLSAGLAVWETVSASRSVLDPRDYARLRVGQDRSEVRKVLPDRQAVHRPPGAEPEERGVTCEFYAMTADRFDDRSGDVYRLCFRGGALASRDALAP
ncbi:sensor histidine kinase [Streptomyces sp. cmx-18-6]|uniref:sensor histidine kinase n=1 Tax=Streptomyces sp. cmx-18-6 TaxID=2790930 RepID=UPI0039805EF2